MTIAKDYEPSPTKNDGPSMHDLVVAEMQLRADINHMHEVDDQTYEEATKLIEDLKERKAFGLSKYGTVLQANNGRNPKIDAYQEALDLCVYFQQIIEENPTKRQDYREIQDVIFGVALALRCMIDGVVI